MFNQMLLSAETPQEVDVLMNGIQHCNLESSNMIFILGSRKLDLVEFAFKWWALLLPASNVSFHTEALYSTKEMG